MVETGIFDRGLDLDEQTSQTERTTALSDKRVSPGKREKHRINKRKWISIVAGAAGFMALGVGTGVAVTNDKPDLLSARTEGALGKIKLPVSPVESRSVPGTAYVTEEGTVLNWFCKATGKKKIIISLDLQLDKATGGLNAVANSNPLSRNGISLREEPPILIPLNTEADASALVKLMEGTPAESGQPEVSGACQRALKK